MYGIKIVEYQLIGRYIRKLEFGKGSKDCNKSKQTSCQLELVGNNFVAIMHQLVVTFSSIM